MINEFSQGMRVLLEKLFEDTCAVWRSHDVRQPNGSIRREFIQIEANVSCRLSRMMSRRVVLSEPLPQTILQSDARLYVASTQDICQGDRIDFMMNTQRYDVLEVFRYPSHMECSLKKVVEA